MLMGTRQLIHSVLPFFEASGLPAPELVTQEGGSRQHLPEVLPLGHLYGTTTLALSEALRNDLEVF